MSIKDMVFKKHLTGLKEGQKAPAFTTTDENGNVVSLSDFEGKKVVLYFYPKDDTSGCTAESCNLRDNYRTFQKQGYEILGVSADSEKSHRKFIYKYSLPFRLLADTDHKLVKAYDVWGTKMLFGRIYDGIVRTTFVISKDGTIEKIITDVNTEKHTEQIL
jgi:peroxiredoxin Q/BCP